MTVNEWENELENSGSLGPPVEVRCYVALCSGCQTTLGVRLTDDEGNQFNGASAEPAIATACPLCRSAVVLELVDEATYLDRLAEDDDLADA